MEFSGSNSEENKPIHQSCLTTKFSNNSFTLPAPFLIDSWLKSKILLLMDGTESFLVLALPTLTPILQQSGPSRNDNVTELCSSNLCSEID